MLTKREAAVIGLYTGVLMGDFGDLHEYAEEVAGRPIWTHEFANHDTVEELKALARPEFLEICKAAV